MVAITYESRKSSWPSSWSIFSEHPLCSYSITYYSNKNIQTKSTVSLEPVSPAHPVSFLFPRVSISSSFLEVQGGSFRCSFLRDPVVLSTTASKGRWRVSLNDLFNTPLSQYAPLIRHSHLQLVRICRIFWTLAETTASLCNHRSLFLTILILG